MPPKIIIIAACGAIGLITFCFILWPLDLINPKERTVGSVVSGSGDQLEVVQWWNKTDFYSVVLRHKNPSGETYEMVVDPDSPKWWSCRLRPEQGQNKIEIVRHFRTVATYDVSKHTLLTANGVTISAYRIR